MNKTKKQIEASIERAIASISEDITLDNDDPKNKIRAEAIKMLAEAYDIVHRGKNAHEF